MTRILLALMLSSVLASSHLGAEEQAPAVHSHQAGMTHGQPTRENLPVEPGQSAFAAIGEIVAKLEADPATDWSKVNIDALRQHLIDMDAVTMRASVKTEPIAHGRIFIVSGNGVDAASIRRMLTGHAATMNGRAGWTFAVEASPDGAAMTVKPPKKDDLVKLDGLGFFGILTMGMHHQEHHWMIANGMHPH